MKRINKYWYLHVLQGHYGHGWEDLCASESWREVRDNLRDYRENEGGRYRCIQRREPNPEYRDPCMCGSQAAPVSCKDGHHPGCPCGWPSCPRCGCV